MFNKLIYLASPYSHPDTNVITRRVLEVQDATARLIEQGHLIFSPIAHSHAIANQVSFTPVHTDSTDFSEGKTWLDYDLAMIDKADELWILRLNGHTRSKGVHAELYHALDQGKKVKYINYPDLTVFADVEAVEVDTEGFPDVWSKQFGEVNTFGKAFPEGPMNQADGFAGGIVSMEFTGRWLEPETPYIDTSRSKPTIIGLTGHAQSGKDTAGKYLVENHGFTRIGLADAVKECLYALNPTVPSYADPNEWAYSLQDDVNHPGGWDHAKNNKRYVRELLQRMGTEVGRKIISETVWLDIAERKIKELGPDVKVVITDIRFPNEAEWVRALGGQVVRINREGFGPVNDHASDQKLEDSLVDVEVENNYDLTFFHSQLNLKVTPYV